MNYLKLGSELDKLGKYNKFPVYLCGAYGLMWDEEVEIPSLDKNIEAQKRLHEKTRKQLQHSLPKDKFYKETIKFGGKVLKKAGVFERRIGNEVFYGAEYPKGTYRGKPGRPEDNPTWWECVWLLRAFFIRFRGRPCWPVIAEIISRCKRPGWNYTGKSLQAKWERKKKNEKFSYFSDPEAEVAYLDEKLRAYDATIYNEQTL